MLLFNLVADAISYILDKPRVVHAVVVHLIDGGGLTQIWYADDTTFIVEGSDLDIMNLKFLLLCFEVICGLKIKFPKSEVAVLWYSRDVQQCIANNPNCRIPSFHVTYLGFPISDSRNLI